MKFESHMKNSNWTRSIASITLILYGVSSLSSPFANAILPVKSGASPTPLPTISGTEEPIKDPCEEQQVCEGFKFTTADAGASQAPDAVPGLTGQAVWGPSDDLICEQLKSRTSETIFAKATPTPNSTYASGKYTCDKYLISDEVFGAVKTRYPDKTDVDYCGLADKLKVHCDFHNTGQFESYCVAYNAIEDRNYGAIAANGTMIGLDAGVVALCGAACASSISSLGLGSDSVSTGLTAACAAAGVAVGATEIVLAATALSTGIAQYTSKIAAYSSLVGVGVAGAGSGVYAGVQAKKDYTATVERAANTNSPANPADPNAPQSQSGSGSNSGTNTGTQDAGPETKNNRTKAACFTAFLFAAMLGVRSYNIDVLRGEKKQLCDNVLSLRSQLTSIISAQNKQDAEGFRHGTFTASGSGGSFSASTGRFASLADKQAAFANCVAANSQSGGFCNQSCNDSCSQAAGIQGNSGATDGTGISRSGLIPPASNAIPNPDDLVKKIARDGAGAGLASALPSSLGSVGAALAGVAQSAQDDAPKLASLFNIPTSYSPGSGGGGRSAASQSDNPFAALMGGGGSGGYGGMGGSTTLQQYGTPGLNDIWHSKSTSSLFEIVSDKYGKVSTRVR